MKKIILLFFFCFLGLQLLAQVSYRKTNKTVPLKAKASFTDPSLADFEQELTFLDQHPVPVSDYGNKKELLNKLRAQTLAPVQNKTQGVAPNPVIIRDWEANPGGIPLDNDVAISNGGTIISAVNSNIRVYDTTGTSIFGKSINAMNSTLSVFTWISDPRLLYDPNKDRFIITCFSGSNSSTSTIIVGFSTTNNPADAWNFYTIDGSPFNDSTWSDYPIIAINDHDFFMTFNMVKDNIGWQNGFKQSVIYQINKMDGFNGTPLNYTLWDSLAWNGRNFRNICPAKPQTNNMGNAMYFLSLRMTDLSNDTIFLLNINDSYQSSNAQFSSDILISPTKYGFPPNVPMTNANYLMTNDARVLTAIYENNYIHFGSNSINPTYNNAGVFLGEIKNISSNPMISGTIFSSNTEEYGYPSMAYVGNENNDHKVIYSFNHCKNGYPGLSMIFKNNFGFSDIISIEDGNSSINALADSNERWGDYSAIQRKFNQASVACIAGSFSKNAGMKTRVAMVNHNDFAVKTENVISNTQNELTLYPNPASEKFSIDFYNPQKQNMQFGIYDMQGKLIHVLLHDEIKEGRNRFSFNLNSLSRGMYMFSIKGDKGITLSRMIDKK